MMSNIGIWEQSMIKLSPNEVKHFGKVFRQFQKTPNQKLKAEIADIFALQIERRATAAAATSKGKISAVDYAQDLYLKFLETLETLLHENAYTASALSRTLNETKPTIDTLVSVAGKTKELTPVEEFRNMSYRIDEKPVSQWADELMNVIKNQLPGREEDILELRLQGKTFNEIDNLLDLRCGRAQQIYKKALRRINNNPRNRQMYEEIFYEDGEIPVNGAYLNYLILNSMKTPDDYEKVLSDSINPVSLFKDAFTDPSVIDEVRSILRKKPSFKIGVKLSEENSTLEYITAFKSISAKIYGKNIIEFY